jgi:hypothetical protein
MSENTNAIILYHVMIVARHGVVKEKSMTEEELHFAEQEREFYLEQALERMETGTLTAEDMEIIRFECGKSKQPSHSQQVLADVFADFGNIFRKA